MITTPSTSQLVRSVASELRAKVRQRRAELVTRAIARGELPPSTRADLVMELAFAPLVSRSLTQGDPIDDEFLKTLVDVVVAGVRATTR